MSYIPKEAIRSLCADFYGNCSVYLSLPFAGECFTLHADRQITAASTIKIPLLALLFKDAEEGRTDLHVPLPLGEDGAVRGSGIIKFLSPDIRLSLYDYATLMMIVSDNTATNRIIDAVGMDRANAFFEENGWKDTYLGRKMFAPTPEQAKLLPQSNLTSARDLGDMMTRILEKRMISARISEQMACILACQQLGKFDKSLPNVWRPNSVVPPLPAIPEGKIAMMQKGGTLTGKVSHDTAIMTFPDGRSAVMVVMTESDDNSKALELIKAISRSVYDRLI